MAGSVIQDPHKTLGWLENKWHEVAKDESFEKKEESDEKRIKSEEEYCEEQLINLRKLIEGNIAEYATVLNDKNIQVPARDKKLLGIITLVEERVKQYHYFLGRLETARKAEGNVAKLETQSLEKIREIFDEIIRLKYHTP
jgi:hypothetical protein